MPEDYYGRITGKAEDKKAPGPKYDWYNRLSGKAQQFEGPLNVERDVEGSADPEDVAVASLADDPAARIRYYSRVMDIPEDRFGVFNGAIVYEQDDGSLQAVVPEGWSPGALLRRTARGVGPAIPAATGLIGGITTIPVGGGVPGATAGAMAGQAAREGLSSMIMDQPISPLRIGVEGAWDAGAQLGGYLISKGVKRALATKAARRVNEYIQQAGMDAVDAMKRAADDLGITLTPAELTNAPRLRSGQKALSSLPESAGVMEDFYTKRGQQMTGVADDFMGRVSPVDDRAVAAEGMRFTADDAIKAIKKNRTRQASPLYRRAFDEAAPVNTEDVIGVIDSRMEKAGRTTRNYLARVRKELVDKVADDTGKVIEVPRTDLEHLQNAAKEEIDDLISQAKRSGANKAANALMEVKNELLVRMDEASPTFAEARKLYGDLSGDVTRAEGGVLMEAAGAKDRQLESLGKRMFEKNSPARIAEARQRIMAVEGGEEAWNAQLRAYLEETFDDASKTAFSNLSRPQAEIASRAPRWWAKLVGDSRQARRLKAAMNDEQWRGFKKMMDVFEASGRALDFNSDTAFKQEFIKELRDDARGTLARYGVQAKNINPAELLRTISEGYQDFRFGRNVEELAEAITAPDSLQALKDIQKMPKKSARAIIAAAHAMGWLTEAGVDSLGSDQNVLPPSMRNPDQEQRLQPQ